MTEVLSIGILQRLLKVRSKEDKTAAQELKRLKEARCRAREELETSINNYNHVTEDGLMDFYIYQIRSQEALEQYLIHEIRRMEKDIS